LDCLDPDGLWIPDGEDYRGLCDRRLVVSSADLVASCSLLDDLLVKPHQMREAMAAISDDWNIEKFTAFHFARHGLLARVKRFPFVMYLVRAPEDPTAYYPGVFVPGLNMVVNYPSELYEAYLYQYLLRSSEDWRWYLGSRYFADLLPCRVYTHCATSIYVDDTPGELCHGAIEEVPANVFFVCENSGGRIIHWTPGRTHDIKFLPDRSVSYHLQSANDDWARGPVIFEQTPALGKMVGLRSGEIYLCADRGGRVVLNRPHCEAWERFRLIPQIRPEPALAAARRA
jgi:hypothetical protein